MNALRITIFALVAAVLSACNTGTAPGGDNYFSSFGTIGSDGWRYDAPVPMPVDTLRDSTATGTLVLSLRHGADYRYSNIWLEISKARRDSVVMRDTFDIILADDFGNWRGKGMGTTLQLTDTLRRHFTISRGDTLMLRHIMRLDTLEAVERVGLILIPDIQ